MKKYLILVEGKADTTFILDILKKIFSFSNDNIKIKDKINKGNKKQDEDFILESNNFFIGIKKLNGYSNLGKLKKNLSNKVKDDYRIICIFDADDTVKHKEHYGGFEKRLGYFNEKKEELGVEFDLFLFPNNKNDGDLEVLLLNIVSDKYNVHFDNYKSYCDTIEEYSVKKWKNELLENKSKVFSYCQVYNGMEKAKEENREYLNSDLWDLEHEYLKPLLRFLKSTIDLTS